MNALFAAVIGLILVLAAVGMHRGFIKGIWPFAALIITMAVLWFLAPYFRDRLIEGTQIDERLELKIYTALESRVMPDTPVSEQVKDWPLPEGMRESLTKAADSAADGALYSALHAVSTSMMRTSISVISYVGGFIVIYLVLLLIGKLLKLAAKLPVLKQADKFLGLVLGLLSAFLLIDIFFLILSGLSHTEFGLEMMRLIAENRFLSALYEINPLKHHIG